MATEKTPPLLSMLQRLPPSKELLDFYHKKLEQYVDDEQRWMKRLASTKKAVDQSMNLEKEIFAQKREITALQKAVTDIREALAQERKINNKLYVENDKLRIREMEDRRKVVACLELCGKSDNDITKMLDGADKRGDLGMDAFVPQRIQDYIDKAKHDPGRFASLRRTVESARLEILALENQIMEQEKCHLEQIALMENERRLNARDREAERVQYESRIGELSNHIKTLEGTHEDTTKELISSQTLFRKGERKWMAEKEFLMRKVQFLQTYGSVLPPSIDGGGFHTENQSNKRRGGELKGHRELQKLTCELAETKKITEDYRMQLLAMDAEMTNLKDLANANKEVLKSRTKSMVDTVDTLKERYESLEKRRKNEGEGYQSDIKLLKQKLEHLEQKLILSSVTKTKEHEYIKKLKSYAAEIERLRKQAKSNPQWVD